MSLCVGSGVGLSGSHAGGALPGLEGRRVGNPAPAAAPAARGGLRQRAQIQGSPRTGHGRSTWCQACAWQRSLEQADEWNSTITGTNTGFLMPNPRIISALALLSTIVAVVVKIGRASCRERV